jgi:phytoene dehydrogenase-like protein
VTQPLDAIVIGSGPNGLSAAIALARDGFSVRVYEAAPTAGGGFRSEALTEPGFTHDVYAAVLAMALASPFLRSLPLAAHGLVFAHPDVPFAHPLDDGSAVLMHRSIAESAASLDAVDARAYHQLMTPIAARHEALMQALLGPLGLRHPLLMASFGIKAIQSAAGFARRHFSGVRARAMFAGAAAHGVVPLEYAATAGYGLGLILAAHSVGWPVVRGGSQRAADAMVSYLRSLGGELVTSERIDSLAQLPPSRVVLCDVTPRQFLSMAGDRLPAGYRRRLERYRYGPGVFKVDWALNAAVPWRAGECRRAGTLHLGGTLEEIAAGERASWQGQISDRPYVLVVQPSIFDATRAPDGRHTLWAYCHVPHGCETDMTPVIEAQIERFAPGFRDCISTRHSMGPAMLERRNANLIGGDITGGAGDLAQIFARPLASTSPYTTAIDGVFLCSSSTPPGGGGHGMCGYYAAQAAMRKLRRQQI